MRYHIDTIPVWDAVKRDAECPFCVLRRKLELSGVDRALGGAVMESDARILVNEKGFCPRHHALLYAQQNRLGHALMTHTHLLETQKRVQPLLSQVKKAAKDGADAPFFKRAAGKGGTREALQKAADGVANIAGTCLLCEDIARGLGDYRHTFFHLYSTDDGFRKAFRASKGVCLRDLPDLLRMAPDELGAAMLSDFCEDIERLTRESLTRVAGELEWFTLKFDYRNADKPWGDSRDSLERAAMKLRGWCLGAELEPK